MNDTTKHPGVIETVKDDGIAVVAGTGKVIGATVDTTEKALAITVKDVAKVGVGVEHATVAVGSGAIKGTEKLAVAAEHAVADIAGGAVKAVGDVASTTVSTVHNVVTKPIPVDKDAPAVAMAK
jgi:hypothetical protein